MKHIFVALALVAVCCMQSTYAVKCYQCRSWTDPECANEHYNSKTHIVDCETQPKPSSMQMKQYKPVTKCNKIVTKDAVGQIVARDCQFEAVGEKEDVCAVSDNRQVISCVVCKGDICNGSGAGRILSMGLISMLAFVIMKFVL